MAGAIEAWSKANRIDPDWMLAMYTVETHFDTNASDGKDSYGVAQIQTNTAQIIINGMKQSYIVTPTELKRCYGLNIRLSCHYFRDLLNQYEGDYIKATRAYNAGPTNVDRGYFKIGHPCLPGYNYMKKCVFEYERILNARNN